jgi:hypothetical protein
MMNYTTVENPTWTQDGSAIDCVVDFVGIGKLPFTANPNDLSHGSEIYARCVAGDFGPVAEYVMLPEDGPQPPTPFDQLPDFMKIAVTDGRTEPKPSEVL